MEMEWIVSEQHLNEHLSESIRTLPKEGARLFHLIQHKDTQIFELFSSNVKWNDTPLEHNSNYKHNIRALFTGQTRSLYNAAINVKVAESNLDRINSFNILKIKLYRWRKLTL